MKAFLKKLYSLLFPVTWTLLTIILLCLPGSALPGAGIFILQGLDKIVHFILFGGITLLWGLYIRRTHSYPKQFKMLLLAALFSIALGITLEYVQRYYISNRTFDVNDIIADTIGALSIFLLLIKKKSLCGNRGRNQN